MMVALEAVYEPTALFSLRPSWATSTGGKSLLLPSPYAIKMAVLDVAIQTSGLAQAKAAWPWIRDLEIGIRLPRQIVVTNLFMRILRIKEIKTAASGKEAAIATAKGNQEWPFQRTIGYREYVYHSEALHLAFGLDGQYVEQLAAWLVQINYFGKRGGFVQLLSEPRLIDHFDQFVILTREADRFPLNGLIQQLDDCDSKMTFEQVDIYNKKRPKRVTRHVVLPYQLARSSRTYSLYEYQGA